jgi:hypothetical protein
MPPLTQTTEHALTFFGFAILFSLKLCSDHLSENGSNFKQRRSQP